VVSSQSTYSTCTFPLRYPYSIQPLLCAHHTIFGQSSSKDIATAYISCACQDNQTILSEASAGRKDPESCFLPIAPDYSRNQGQLSGQSEPSLPLSTQTASRLSGGWTAISSPRAYAVDRSFLQAAEHASAQQWGLYRTDRYRPQRDSNSCLSNVAKRRTTAPAQRLPACTRSSPRRRLRSARCCPRPRRCSCCRSRFRCRP